MALRRVHVWERDGRYFWRVRLPHRLAPRLGRAVIAWSLGTREPAEARRRAARATAAFETFAAMLGSAPLRQPTDAEMMQVLRGIYDDIVLGKESIRAAVLSPAEMAEGGLTPDPLTPEEIDLFTRDQDEQSAEAWEQSLRDNDRRRVQPLVAERLAERGLALPDHFHLHRTLLRMALRVIVHAKKVSESEGDGDLAAFPSANAIPRRAWRRCWSMTSRSRRSKTPSSHTRSARRSGAAGARRRSRRRRSPFASGTA